MNIGLGRARDPTYPLAVSTMYGLGDTIYQRPFLRAWGAVAEGGIYVRNPWPELLDDLPGVHVCYPHAVDGLRTQAKNATRQNGRAWAQWPPVHQGITARYYIHDHDVTILGEMERHLPLNGEPLVFDLPDFDAMPALDGWDGLKPIAVLRPVTYRREWVNTARPPKHEYIYEAAVALRERGYHVVAVADLDPPHEWIGEPIPIADTYFLRGELDVRQLLSLVAGADLCVGGVGWLVPAALAARTPLVGICGGQGCWNHPEVITDPRVDSPASFIMPEPYCRCPENLHDCRKDIPDFSAKLGAALDEMTAQALCTSTAYG